jgi:hypothetical protein
MKDKTFTVKINDTDTSVTIVSPSLKDQNEARKVYNNAFTEALKSKAVVRARLDDLLVDQGLWDDNKQQKFDTLQREILEGEKRLAKGGIPLSQAKEIALEMRENRDKLRDLISVKTNLDTHTAEGQADNAQFNYFVYACTLYTDNKQKVFSSYDDYLNRASEPVAIQAAQNLANMIYGLDNDYESKLPENKFLKNYKFVDEKLRLINKEGKLVDSDGRLIDEKGRYINTDGEYVDKYGNLLTEQGDYKVEFSPFLDDNGLPVQDNENQPKTEIIEESITETVVSIEN